MFQLGLGLLGLCMQHFTWCKDNLAYIFVGSASSVPQVSQLFQ